MAESSKQRGETVAGATRTALAARPGWKIAAELLRPPVLCTSAFYHSTTPSFASGPPSSTQQPTHSLLHSPPPLHPHPSNTKRLIFIPASSREIGRKKRHDAPPETGDLNGRNSPGGVLIQLVAFSPRDSIVYGPWEGGRGLGRDSVSGRGTGRSPHHSRPQAQQGPRTRPGALSLRWRSQELCFTSSA